jgi:DNA-binding NarL/FixJ family response regulator
MDGKIRVLIVDDHPLMRVGTAAIVNAQPDMEVVCQASCTDEAIELFAKHHPDVTLMDLRLPGRSGADAIRSIRQMAPDARIVVLTTYEGEEDIHQAIEAGAQGYVIKGMPYELLVSAIRKVHRGSRFLPPPVAKVLTGQSPGTRLTAREREVVTLMVAGKSNTEIADELGITRATVKTHVSTILARLGVIDRTQAVVAALQKGITHL